MWLILSIFKWSNNYVTFMIEKFRGFISRNFITKILIVKKLFFVQIIFNLIYSKYSKVKTMNLLFF